MAPVLEMFAAINDAPTDDLDVEDEVFSADRLRAFHAAQEAQRRRVYQLAARHRDSGVLVGHTMVAVEGDRPHYGHQLDTSVLAEHRGHRLGMLVEVAALRALQAASPSTRLVSTWNADSNRPMIAVNEALGFGPAGTGSSWTQRLAAP